MSYILFGFHCIFLTAALNLLWNKCSDVKMYAHEDICLWIYKFDQIIIKNNGLGLSASKIIISLMSAIEITRIILSIKCWGIQQLNDLLKYITVSSNWMLAGGDVFPLQTLSLWDIVYFSLSLSHFLHAYASAFWNTCASWMQYLFIFVSLPLFFMFS